MKRPEVRLLARSPRPTRFSGKKGELLPIVAPANLTLSRIVLAGLGKVDQAADRVFEELGGALAAHLDGAGETEATVFVDITDEAPIGAAEAAAEIAFGAQLRSYRFNKYKTKQNPEQKPSLVRLTVSTDQAGAAKRAYRPLEKTVEAVFFTRDLVSEPANVIFPETLAEQARTLEELGVEVEVLDEKAMRKLGMGALLGVGQGSAAAAAARGHAMARRRRRGQARRAARLRRQGRHLRHRRHLDQAGRRHGGHEVGHGAAPAWSSA